MAKASDIRNGLMIKYNGDIFTIVSFQHVKMGRGGAFYRAKMKSVTTGKVIENSFNSSAKLDDVRVERRKYQYLYNDGDSLVFMNTETFEQINMEPHRIDGIELLLEEMVCEVLFNTQDDSILTVEMPTTTIQEITYTEPGIKGDTATNTLKPATVESGAEVRVPLFINIGDKIKIDTAKKSYMERVKQ